MSHPPSDPAAAELTEPLPRTVGGVDEPTQVFPVTPPGAAGGPGAGRGGARSRAGGVFAAAALIGLGAGLLGGVAVVGVDRVLTAGPEPLPAPSVGTTARPDGSIASIAAAAIPSVVTVKVRGSDGAGTGSGFVLDKNGHVLTNNHVIAAAATSGTITLLLSNGTAVPASIVGRDVSYDLAVLHVDGAELPALPFGRSADVVVGDGVLAVGAPLGLDATVTSGIVSALDRPVTPGSGDDQSYISAIQTDAAINPGNSGGPLLDLNGHVVGVTSAIARLPGASDAAGSIGLGFAIPSDQAFKVAQQLITTGKAQHPAMGVRLDTRFEGEGALIAKGDGVIEGSSAQAAGLQDGDIVVEFEGRRITEPNQLIVAIRSRSVGDTVTLKVDRGDEILDVTMTLQAATG